MDFKAKNNLLSVLCLCITLMTITKTYSSIQQSPCDVQVLAFDASWCSGSYPVDNLTLAWDIYTITSVTLGIANLDTNDHTINQLNVSINQANAKADLMFLKSVNLTAVAGLPLVLSPGYYWQFNLSCDKCQSLDKIRLEIDGEWFTFLPHEMIKNGTSVWPDHWTNVHHYSKTTSTSTLEEKTTTPSLTPGFPLLIMISFITVITLARNIDRAKGND
ncbi:MAG: hypothetical protein JSV04_12225 [Candidatus Heimdallarchaeota archaeon]|nr:MAG: hypothetical protein JSV04_12225 [Candidatus Heimdallarchaeota archaeon]